MFVIIRFVCYLANKILHIKQPCKQPRLNASPQPQGLGAGSPCLFAERGSSEHPVVSPQPEAGFRPLFDGTAATFKNWRLAGPPGGGMLHTNGDMVSYGSGGLRLFCYAVEKFSDFTLRLQFRIVDVNAHNSGVFIRFPSPTLDFATDELKRRAGLEAAFDPGNPAWKSVIAGFEVQIDDTAAGDSTRTSMAFVPSHRGCSRTAPARSTRSRRGIASGTRTRTNRRAELHSWSGSRVERLV